MTNFNRTFARRPCSIVSELQLVFSVHEDVDVTLEAVYSVVYYSVINDV